MAEQAGIDGLSVVRKATRKAHYRLESSIDLSSWDTSRHRSWLSRLVGLHEPLEANLDEWWVSDSWMSSGRPTPDWPRRRRTELLVADLSALGLSSPDIAALPRSAVPSPPVDLLEVLGQLYVLDGSALGGAVIASRAIAAGVPSAACQSLVPRKATARAWRETRSLIEALPATEAARTATAATELFDLFERWLSASQPEEKLPPHLDPPDLEQCADGKGGDASTAAQRAERRRSSGISASSSSVTLSRRSPTT